MADIGSGTSRRAMLGALTVASIATLPGIAVASPWDAAIAALPYAGTDEPVSLRRSRRGRRDSEFRYHNAEEFFASVEGRNRACDRVQLYNVGIVLQLGISSHLLDVGFDDRWCARNVGLRVAKSLAYANATGLGHKSSDLESLTAFLSPYGKWRHIDGVPSDCPFSSDEIRHLTRELLERIHQVTGHPRPPGWQRRFT